MACAGVEATHRRSGATNKRKTGLTRANAIGYWAVVGGMKRMALLFPSGSKGV